MENTILNNKPRLVLNLDTLEGIHDEFRSFYAYDKNWFEKYDLFSRELILLNSEYNDELRDRHDKETQKEINEINSSKQHSVINGPIDEDIKKCEISEDYYDYEKLSQLSEHDLFYFVRKIGPYKTRQLIYSTPIKYEELNKTLVKHYNIWMEAYFNGLSTLTKTNQSDSIKYMLSDDDLLDIFNALYMKLRDYCVYKSDDTVERIQYDRTKAAVLISKMNSFISYLIDNDIIDSNQYLYYSYFKEYFEDQFEYRKQLLESDTPTFKNVRKLIL